MSKAKHTPGPWSHYPEDNIITAEATPHATLIEWQARSLHVSIAERDANARLIAAAPELLAALQEAIGAVRVFHGPDEWETYRDHSPEMRRWHTLIAKATGATP